MGHGNELKRIADIRNMRELRETRRVVDLKMWYTRQRLVDNAEALFSVDNLVSAIAPPGSAADRLIGGAGMLAATVRGVIKGIRVFRSRH